MNKKPTEEQCRKLKEAAKKLDRATYQREPGAVPMGLPLTLIEYGYKDPYKKHYNCVYITE